MTNKNGLHLRKPVGLVFPAICFRLFPIVLLLIAFMGFVSPLYSSNCVLKGFVKEKGTDTPLEEVTVTILSLKLSTVRYELLTDKNGYFYKTGLLHGPYVITLDKKGYVPAQDTVRLRVSQQYDLDVEMEKIETDASGADSVYALVLSAKKLMSEGQYDKAIAKIDKAIETDPGSFILFYNRGLGHEKKNDIPGAVADYLKSLELKSDFLLPLSALGKIYAKKANYQKAGEYYKKAFDLGITDTIALYNYGACLVNLGKTDEAKRVFQKIIALDPGYPDAYYQLGIIYLGLNDNSKAGEFLKKFTELDPKNPNAAVAKEILESLK